MSRVTNNMMIRDFNNNFNRSQTRLNKYMNQLATGKEFTRVSEDSLKATKALQLKTSIAFNDRYIENAQEGIKWLETTDRALDDVVKTLRRVRDLGVQAANGALGQEETKKLQAEVDQLRGHLVNVANTSYGDRYIFNGTRTKEEPYRDAASIEPDDYYTADDVSDGVISREVSQGITVDINVSGDSIGDGGFSEIFADLQRFSDALGSNDKEAIGESIANIDNHIEETLMARARTGARQNRLELMVDRMEAQKINYTDILNETEGANIPEAIMGLKTEESINRSALAVGARLIQPTLIDFLR